MPIKTFTETDHVELVLVSIELGFCHRTAASVPQLPLRAAPSAEQSDFAWKIKQAMRLEKKSVTQPLEQPLEDLASVTREFQSCRQRHVASRNLIQSSAGQGQLSHPSQRRADSTNKHSRTPSHAARTSSKQLLGNTKPVPPAQKPVLYSQLGQPAAKPTRELLQLHIITTRSNE